MEYLIYILTSLVVVFALLLWFYSCEPSTGNLEVKTSSEEGKPDIREAVYAFVETVKKDRKRFTFKQKSEHGVETFTCKDKKNEDDVFYIKFSIHKDSPRMQYICPWRPSNNLEFLTQEECEYIVQSLREYFFKLESRAKKIENIRKYREVCEKYYE